jgi:low affinity Fe/Cu permease
MTTTEVSDKRDGQPSGEDDDVMPSQEGSTLSLFDRFATASGSLVSRAWFFLACVVLVLIWAPTFVFMPLDTWQLIINTATTIITFLLVALLQNTQKRADDSVQQKLNAIAEALSDLMRRVAGDEAAEDAKQLRAAVGLEQREGSD